MSIKTLLMPGITQRLLSRTRLLERRAKAERARLSRSEPHRVHYFHQVDDPYSALLASALPQLLTRYDIDLVPHIVGPPPDSAAPAREKLIAYSRKDAQLLARRFGLEFQDQLAQPEEPLVRQAAALLVAAVTQGNFPETAGAISAALWNSGPALSELALPRADAASVASHLAASQSLRGQMGHYLGATLYYGGEWYWGPDRLHHLEQRLQALGAGRGSITDLMFAPGVDLTETKTITEPPPIDFFFSLRSPYSAIVAPRVFELARLTGAHVNLRFVLPMVMRGLPVPKEKRMYISQDAAREAHARGIAFGRLNDPVGKPTERGLSLIPLAEREGLGQAYVLSYMRGVWSEGIDAGSDRGLRKIVERAGLDWAQASIALRDDAWRKIAEQNRADLFALGLWGVPSFKVRDVAVWGQDRLWAVQDELLLKRPA